MWQVMGLCKEEGLGYGSSSLLSSLPGYELHLTVKESSDPHKHHPYGRKQRRNKNLLMKVKEKSEQGGWKLNIQKTKIMESGPITSWEIDGETVETVSDFIF